MGKNNRQRRAAKAREKAKRRSRPTPPRATDHHEARHAGRREDRIDALESMCDEYEIQLHRLLHAIWAGGWQPAELVREISRSTKGAVPSQLLRSLLAADHARRSPSTLHPRWHLQVAALDLPTSGGERGWLAETLVAGDTSDELDDRHRSLIDLVGALSQLSPLPRLIPPPGGSDADVDIHLTAGADDVADPILERVRALLAQAESTSYPAEAETFTAKAHELITRHAIDLALVEGTRVAAGWTTAVRIPIDDPYVDSKTLLLHVVADHSRCRAVSHSRYAMSTVLGASSDVTAVEMLFTSLLLQGQQALLAEGARTEPGAHQRSRTFRASFLLAYANRIGERLAEVSETVAADVSESSGVAVLPVLADRRSTIDAEIARLFGAVTSAPVRGGWDAAGWSSGRRAADRARLFDPDLAASSPDELSA